MNVTKLKLKKHQAMFNRVWFKGTEFYVEPPPYGTLNRVYASTGEFLGTIETKTLDNSLVFEEVGEGCSTPLRKKEENIYKKLLEDLIRNHFEIVHDGRGEEADINWKHPENRYLAEMGHEEEELNHYLVKVYKGEAL